ncbi:hypothetical protein SADUNF_Sadunf03G0160900 [Salix dunnii]|uniref:Uncharacterized protein n=1 Tax=Salix dunnii TaxID=1413687 RepID=A0A835TEI0_9ROSI|nr:hypothetical protein SADUNF_Sadunf03G0160900 [Salix dunnii]
MGNIPRAFFVLFSLIVIHVLMSSLLCLHYERKVQLLDRNQGRRLLVSVTSLSANANKSTGANKVPQKAAEASLRKAPPNFRLLVLLLDRCHNGISIQFLVFLSGLRFLYSLWISLLRLSNLTSDSEAVSCLVGWPYYPLREHSTPDIQKVQSHDGIQPAVASEIKASDFSKKKTGKEIC